MIEKSIKYLGEEFELEVLTYIQSKCSGNESVLPFMYDPKNYRNFLADAFLSSGCEKLNIKRNTFIEIKYRILSDTFSRWVRNIKSSFPPCTDYSFLMIYESSIDYDLGNLKIDGYDISIINIKSLGKRGDENFIQPDSTKLEESKISKEIISRPTQEELLASLKEEILKKNICLFLGAGVSVSGGLPSWENLLSNFAKELNPGKSPSIISDTNINKLQKASFNSAIVLARYLRVGKNYPSNFLDPSLKVFYRKLHNSLYGLTKGYKEKKLIKSITKLITKRVVKAVITYNFDDYLEDALNKKKFKYQSINDGARLSAGYLPIYHVHGFLPINPNPLDIPNPVFTEESYHALYKDAYQWSNVEQLHALNNTTCVLLVYLCLILILDV